MYSEELLNLDKRPLKGEISEEFYEEKREDLLKWSVQNESLRSLHGATAPARDARSLLTEA